VFAFGALVLLGAAAFDGRGTLALIAFGVATLSYAAVNLAGPVLTSSLAPVDQGESMGLFMATTSLGWLLGSALGGWAASTWGYGAVPVLATIGVGAALALSLRGEMNE
jgi:predicted MFS family arabinose efflux permease